MISKPDKKVEGTIMCGKNIWKNVEKILCIIDWIGEKLMKIPKYIKRHWYVVDLKGLSELEKNILKKFYLPALNEYTLDYVTLVETDETHPIILKLIDRNILVGYTIPEKIEHYTGDGIGYRLTKRARKKLNKKQRIFNK